jgi:two-component system sensor histidine kinase/response regulator
MIRSTPTILAVDDIEKNLQLLGTLLTGHGYEVVFAQNGETAIARAKAQTPDLILLDLLMPDMDGYEVIRRLKAMPSLLSVPVIFLTASGDTDKLTLALRHGAVDYITKPFDHDELLARISTQIALKKARDELEAIVDERNRLMAVLAHDLRNPLSVIRMAVRLLSEMDFAQAEKNNTGELFESMEESAVAMDTLIERHLVEAAAANRLKRIETIECNLGDALTSAVRQFSARAQRKGITLETNVSFDWVYSVNSDPVALRQIIENLLSNAIKFSPPESAVSVLVEELDGSWKVSVIDQGPGLTPEDFERLWNPFSRLSAQPTGGEPSTGLGLSIVRDVVERLGGECGCESEPSKGAQFWFAIPKIS